MPGKPQAGLKASVRYNMCLPTALFPTKVYSHFKLFTALVIYLYSPFFYQTQLNLQDFILKR